METTETKPMNWKPYQKANECGCVLCGKPLPTRTVNDKGLYIHIGEGGLSILRADLPLNERELTILSTGPDTGDMGWFQIGPSCAKKVGKAFVKELDVVAYTPDL